jgi:hypothetical protein
MKNIHVLPTDKPSRLQKFINYVVDKIEFELCSKAEFFNKGQHIYITNSEKPKTENWVLGDFPDNPIGKVISKYGQEFTAQSLNGNKYGLAEYDSKKIILTTDQDLIADGVQAIPDEFLEWFVKNPSCESVEVSYGILKPFQSTDKGYMIHLPDNDVLEEPKQDTVGKEFYESADKVIVIHRPKQENRKVCKCKRAYENPLSEICSLCWNELYPNEKDEIKEEDLLEPKQEGYICPQTKKQCHDECCVSAEDCHIEAGFGIVSDCEPPKEETLEEAIKQELENHFFSNISEIKQAEYFINFGARWQQEQDKNKYSEEEVLDLLYKRDLYLLNRYEEIELELPEEWFEQFKKKQEQ